MDELARDVERGRALTEERRWRDATESRPMPAGRELQTIESIWTGDGPRDAMAPTDTEDPLHEALRREAARLFVLAHAASSQAAFEALASQRVAGPGPTVTLARLNPSLANEQRAGARKAWQHARDKLLQGARAALSGRAAAATDAWASLRIGDGAAAAAASLGWSVEDLRGQMEALLAASDDAWRDLGGWLLDRRLGVRWEGATEADVRCLLGGPGLTSAFPAGGARLAATTTGETCGLWPASVTEDTTDRDRGPAGAVVASVRTPGDVRLAFPGAAPHGPGPWSSSLRALGQAAAAAAVHPDHPPATRVALATSEARAVGAVLATLILEPGWWRRHVSGTLDRDMAREVALCRVGELRVIAARTLATLSILRDGPTAEVREAATAIWRRALGVEPGPWCWLWELDQLLMGAETLSNDDSAASRTEAMVERHDEQWFRVRGAGAELLTPPLGGVPTPPPEGDRSLKSLRRALQGLD